MIKYTLYYTDGSTTIKYFSSIEEATWFIHNEGDHLSGYTIEGTSHDSIN